MYFPSKIWRESIGVNGTRNVFAIHNFGHVAQHCNHVVSSPDENNNIKKVYTVYVPHYEKQVKIKLI